MRPRRLATWIGAVCDMLTTGAACAIDRDYGLKSDTAANIVLLDVPDTFSEPLGIGVEKGPG